MKNTHPYRAVVSVRRDDGVMSLELTCGHVVDRDDAETPERVRCDLCPST